MTLLIYISSVVTPLTLGLGRTAWELSQGASDRHLVTLGIIPVYSPQIMFERASLLTLGLPQLRRPLSPPHLPGALTHTILKSRLGSSCDSC